VGAAGDFAVDMCLILAAVAPEPTTIQVVQGWIWLALQICLGLGFVIFVHELGHFLVAKACGVKCDKFYIGFDVPMPKLFGWQIPSKLLHFQWGETEYGIGILPLGGYVKMLGQDDDPRHAEAEAERTKVKTETGDVKLDPRSFPAKSVPARMAIISAGVIMNLIFAVILAMIAFSFGVPEVPAIIGETTPGGPAWTANIKPGSKILRFGDSGEPYEHLRWDDLRREVVLSGFDRKLPILIRTPDGQKVRKELLPSELLRKLHQPTLGVVQQMTREVRPYEPDRAYRDAQTDKPLEDGDVIVAVGGKRLEADYHLQELLTQQPQGPLTITVSRSEKAPPGATPLEPKRTEFDVVLQPRPMPDLGLALKPSPIIAIRDESPAKDAEFQVGDELLQVNGQPIGDPLSLGQRLVPKGDRFAPITFTVARTDSKGVKSTRTITVTPELPLQQSDNFNFGSACVESVGIAYNILPVVVLVEPGSPAEKAGLKPGDIVTQAEFVAASDAARDKELLALGKDAFKPIVLDDTLKSWTTVVHRLQESLPDTEVKLTWTREGKVMTGQMLPVPSTTFFDESRGLQLYAQKKIHKAGNATEALLLGFRETRDRLGEVVRIIGALFSRKIPASNLSGPIGIIQAAGSFASEGVPKMLMFLTLLSANLAVLNFLPIPALDGGHMMFLTAEWIRGKPVDEKLQIRLTIAGVLCLLSLMVFATAMDLGRWFS
jgi:regulator of sigma E protease